MQSITAQTSTGIWRSHLLCKQSMFKTLYLKDPNASIRWKEMYLKAGQSNKNPPVWTHSSSAFTWAWNLNYHCFFSQMIHQSTSHDETFMQEASFNPVFIQGWGVYRSVFSELSGVPIHLAELRMKKETKNVPFYINLAEQTFDTLLHNTNIIYYQVFRFSRNCQSRPWRR